MYARLMAAGNARLLLQKLSPDDALAIASYAFHGLASLRAAEGVPFKPLVEAIVASAGFVCDNIDNTRYARPAEGVNPLARKGDGDVVCDSEASDGAAWAEGFVDALMEFGLLSPGSVAITVEFMLHHIARAHEINAKDLAVDNRLGIEPLAVPPETRAIAQAMLSNYVESMRVLLPTFDSESLA